MTAKQAIASYERILRILHRADVAIDAEILKDGDSNTGSWSLDFEISTAYLADAIRELEARQTEILLATKVRK